MNDRPPPPGRSPADRLGHLDLAPFVDELVRRFSSGDRPVRITLPATLGDSGLARLADLLALDRYPTRGQSIAVDRIAAAVGTTDPEGLRTALIELRGPLGDRRAAQAAGAAARSALWRDTGAAASRLPLFAAPGAAERLVERLAATGVPAGDIAAHGQLLDAALACLARLPAVEPVSLAGLAADETGTAHGLDPGLRLTRVVLEGLAVAFGADPPTDAESARALWEQAGVVPDPVSSSVLTLGLRPADDDPLAVFLRAASADGEPVVLTLRQLQRRPVSHRPDGGVAYLVENPSLVAEAAGRWSGPPLLCSSGRPSMAVVTLVRQLVAAGTEVRQHADFDAAGVDITRWLQARAGCVPWRMGADDYLHALANRPSTALVGDPGATPWDPALAQTMRSSGRAVHEEAIRTELLDAMRARTH